MSVLDILLDTGGDYKNSHTRDNILPQRVGQANKNRPAAMPGGPFCVSLIQVVHRHAGEVGLK